MLRLLSMMQTRRHWSGEELAARLEVSPRTVRRDVDRLRELGYPVLAARGLEGGYQLAPGAALPPLLLDDEEAVALAVGLQEAAQAGVAGIAEASVRALAKVTQVMPGPLRRRVEALRTMTLPGWQPPGGGADPAVLAGLAQACRDAERVRFGYRAADGRESRRLAEPHRLVCVGRRWYLVAYDLDRQDWRTFRTDRIDDLQTTGARFRPRDLPASDAAEFVRSGLRDKPVSRTVEALVDAPAAAVRDRLGRWSTVEELPDGRSRVTIRSDSLDWPAMALGSLDAEFTVLGPPEMIDYLTTCAQRFTRATTPDPTTPDPTTPG
jgi:predicted DNA-binding transcriptional regulator YafY